ncbi:hypothetical protein CSOJ01_04378 [Colletotrichum sojae]|uniref:Uncharacterized protein n=1 Tax=Colletotrichum sojae TaxID=2175907 RepID=A0A8H6MZB0_9PEZI|nr:hypothetical protein CSOJ01_04378 [Colletotrichum sojae]
MKSSVLSTCLAFLMFSATALGQGNVGGLCEKDSDCLACLNDGTGRRLFCPEHFSITSNERDEAGCSS